MLIDHKRVGRAKKAALLHLLISLFVASLLAVLVFVVWYPFPYREIAGGRELFLLVMGVDVVCGPLLTFVIFNPSKKRRELMSDLLIVIVLQIAALAYGLWTVWQARPLYLVLEIDRFKVISQPDIGSSELQNIPDSLRQSFWQKPRVIGLREPISMEEKHKVLMEAVAGGKDLAERPEFYIPYDDMPIEKRLIKSKPIELFIKKYPHLQKDAQLFGNEKVLRYLPIIGRSDWIAVMDAQGQIAGYLAGDGF